jgi:hypothetical protein
LQAIVETPHEDGYYYWQILSNEPEQMPFLLDIPADALQGFLDSSDVIEAQTLEELAEKISVDKSEFLSTIEKYNALCDLGFDEDFGKLSDYLIRNYSGVFVLMVGASWLLAANCMNSCMLL